MKIRSLASLMTVLVTAWQYPLSAQEPRGGLVPAPVRPAAVDCPGVPGGPCESAPCMAIRPATETVKHTRICYDCKEYHYARTCGAKTPILTRDCPECDK